MYRDHNAETPWSGIPLIEQPPPLVVRIFHQGVFRLKCWFKDLIRPAPADGSGHER
jgi:hypothetical protein